jgi:GntR family transcriptional regulator, transcriptional repressor for pyruvate dehydrogenase complex
MRNEGSLSDTVFRGMLDRVRTGAWPAGGEIPSERSLIDEFEVSRVPLREALSSLRALGILETRQGSGTRVRRVDVDTVARLLPLLVTLEGPRTFEQIFELRLSIEPAAAAFAAQRHAEDDAVALRALVDRFRADLDAGLPAAIETDLAFHIRIAEAARNPLFSVLMRTLAELLRHVQLHSCKDDPARRRRAVDAHAAIADAILARDPERSRVEMEAHLRFSASRLTGGFS